MCRFSLSIRVPVSLVLAGCLGLLTACAPAKSPSRNDPPGTRYPSMKIVFEDPVTRRTVWRMTTDGKQFDAANHMGDLSSEVSSWSADSHHIVYGKQGHLSKPDGVYLMDVETGEETYLAFARSTPYPVFSRTTNEVFYSFGRLRSEPAASWHELRAVDLESFRVRTVARFDRAIFLGPAAQNRDGSLLAVSPLLGIRADGFNSWSEQTVVMTPQGEIHPKWRYDPNRFSALNANFAMWSPVDSRLLITRRFVSDTEAVHHFWNVDTLINPFPKAFGLGHASWHPNGTGYLHKDFYDLRTGKLLHATGLPGGPHPNINPTEGALGLAARVVFDARKGPPFLIVQKLEDLPVDWTDASSAWCLHYASSRSNRAHAHPHWSPDGRLVLWQSDVAETSLGTPPGGSDDTPTTVDLFIAPIDSGATDARPAPS